MKKYLIIIALALTSWTWSTSIVPRNSQFDGMSATSRVVGKLRRAQALDDQIQAEVDTPKCIWKGLVRKQVNRINKLTIGAVYAAWGQNVIQPRSDNPTMAELRVREDFVEIARLKKEAMRTFTDLSERPGTPEFPGDGIKLDDLEVGFADACISWKGLVRKQVNRINELIQNVIRPRSNKYPTMAELRVKGDFAEIARLEKEAMKTFRVFDEERNIILDTTYYVISGEKFDLLIRHLIILRPRRPLPPLPPGHHYEIELRNEKISFPFLLKTLYQIHKTVLPNTLVKKIYDMTGQKTLIIPPETGMASFPSLSTLIMRERIVPDGTSFSIRDEEFINR